MAELVRGGDSRTKWVILSAEVTETRNRWNPIYGLCNFRDVSILPDLFLIGLYVPQDEKRSFIFTLSINM